MTPLATKVLKLRLGYVPPARTPSQAMAVNRCGANTFDAPKQLFAAVLANHVSEQST